MSTETIELSQARDRDALNRLSEALSVPVFNLAIRFFGTPADAEDEAQNALLHVLQVLPRFEHKSRFSTWCYRVVVNRFLNAKRKSFESITVDVGAQALDAGLEHHHRSGAYRGPDAEVLADEVKLSCTTALLVCLTRPLRMAYILGEILGLNAPEGASVLEIEPAAFRKRLSMARKEVREFLGPRCGWLDTTNPCRCDHQIDYDLKIGWIARDRLKYAQAKTATTRAKERLSSAFDAASLYRTHPTYEAPASLKETLQVALGTLQSLGDELDRIEQTDPH